MNIKSNKDNKKKKKVTRKLGEEEVIDPNLINLIITCIDARAAYKAEIYGERANRKSARAQTRKSELNIELSLMEVFKDEVKKLRDGEVTEFIFSITQEAFPYLGTIVRARKDINVNGKLQYYSELYPDLHFTKITPLKYRVTLFEEEIV